MRKLPDDEKRKRGTDQPSRLTGSGPQWDAFTEIPQCPERFNSDEREAWMDLCGQLLKAGILCTPYLPTIEGYCTAYATWQDATKGLKEEGLYQVQTFMSGHKKIIVNPLTKVQTSAMATMLSYAGRLGVTPKDRDSVQGNESGEPTDGLLK